MTDPASDVTDLVTLTIDGTDVAVPKGTLVIRAAEQVGIAIPRFCDHPLLDPVAACRACLVDVPDAGNGRGMKPQPACALEVAPGMKIATGATSATARAMNAGIMEFLLINHPLDCPMCDKAGECPLQNQAMTDGRADSRYDGAKRRFPKPVPVSSTILLDRERCVLCQRCTRFSEQISGDPFICLAERGAKSQIARATDVPYDSYFAGNVVQICPVGALTSADYRFQARPIDLAGVATTCENCAAGCALRTDARRYAVKRRLAAPDPAVNEDWSCDRGRFAFRSGHLPDRLTTPLIRRGGVLEPASWPEALAAAAEGLSRARRSVGVLTGGRLTLENALAYSRFARAVVGSNNIDFRARATSPEETDFLTWLATRSQITPVDYEALERAKQVVLVSLEPEEECPMIFLRLRKAWRKRGLMVTTIAAYGSRGARKLGARLRATRPGAEASVLRGMAEAGALDADTILLVGERAALSPGLLSEVARLGEAGLRIAWVPRRAGELAALRAGCLPGLLPAGRCVADEKANIELAAMWHMPIPDSPGLDAPTMLASAADGKLAALVVGGVDLADLPDPGLAQRGLAKAFTVSLEQRASGVVSCADVVLPVALLEEQEGTFINWAGQSRHVGLVNRAAVTPMPDVRVLAALAKTMGKQVAMRNMRSPAQSRAIYAEIADERGGLTAPRPLVEPRSAEVPRLLLAPDAIEVTLAGWRTLLDESRCLDGADSLRAGAPPDVMRMSAVTAAKLGLESGAIATLTAGESAWTGPVEVVSMVDDVVWIPLRAPIARHGWIDAQPGDRVRLMSGGAA